VSDAPQGGEHTRAVRAAHGGAGPVAQHPLGPVVHRTATWAFDSAAEMEAVFAGEQPGWSYSRTDNPSAAAFARAVADLEGAEAGEALSSGTAAVTAALLALTSAGARVVAPREVYGGTWALLVNQLGRFGVTTDLVDTSDLAAVEAALQQPAAVLWAEVLSNPTMAVADLPGLSALARAAGVPLVVDATFASPAACRPLEHGADLVVHSATKYLGGHSDATGGVVVGGADLVARVRRVRIDTGAALSPDDAVLLQRGLHTLPLRVARQCATALQLARALEQHPAVERVDHPGLPSHRDHAVALRVLDEGRYGAIVTVTPRGGREAGTALVDRLRLVARATSLGGTVTKAVHVVATTHRGMTPEVLAAGGIGQSSVRVSVGLEDADDLIADLQQALDGL
jgi:cystathionine beta-lyase/cystathionine gamma-synthase